MEDEEDIETSRKLQRISSDNNDKTEMRDWSNLSSRIIRVSRASGGKDRHSKVLTSKGLRDRRIRLSVATAIQFYDLQDRLGFDQPSKAVEWLINAASDSISDLEPIETNFDQTLSLSKSSTSESSLLSLSRTESRGKAREKGLQSSFTQLLTTGLDEPNRNWTGGGSSDCFNPVQLIPSSFVPNYNFGISSSDSPGAAGCYSSRGTLQSNSQPLFLNNNINQRSISSSSSSSFPMDSQSISFFMTPPLDHHNHQLPEAFDGRLYLYYGEGNRSSDDKGKERR
ncbi:unnamed protein product [Eruca vesicaria subsp. sativa]|uniref:TCP domain-containing protein n=1 Tax=Eruca vesicaria subsp. sativa TaxID=29727 RepID=A0ABC8KAF7_ERUVS|nr:unnamed protein product [Eruca vesicaria subsp. sativa]